MVFSFYFLLMIIFAGKNAIDPFLTESPFDILTNPNYQLNIDTLYIKSPVVSFVVLFFHIEYFDVH